MTTRRGAGQVHGIRLCEDPSPSSTPRRPRRLPPRPHASAPITLFLSDLHLGRGTPVEERAAERDAVALLDHYASDLVGGGALYLVGDVFEQWIEYKHLAPKGAVRFLGRLAALADAGAPVTYVVGNRDPWHLDLFEREVGVRLVRGGLSEKLAGRHVYIAHGDGHAAAERGLKGLKLLLRSPHMARLYRMGLPGDAGYAFARWSARRFGTDGAPTARAVEGLRRAAAGLLASKRADLVVFGHAHRAECVPLPGGAYLNPGYWFADRTLGRLDGDGTARLLRWADGRAEELAAVPVAGLAACPP